ncbi:M67 family metallopeptidase [soil metagenome]
MTAEATAATLKLSDGQQSAMYRHAERAYPDECCGAIFGNVDGDAREIVELRELENSWDPIERRRRFLITPAEYMRVEREADDLGLSLIGFYHSHPNAEARPSDFDREHAWPWFAYPIIEVRDGEAISVRVWQLQDNRQGYDELALRLTDE